jgi:redox-sensitive bicupin YhaK (pirin superfamily)
LFSGEIVHRDSVGSLQSILPGDVNWMVAGRGITHSERSSDAGRRDGFHLHGIQSWVALPREHEEIEPSFAHHPARTVPSRAGADVLLDVIAGSAFGMKSPVAVLSPTLYVHARLERAAQLTLDTEHAERAVYIVEGAVSCDGQRFEAGNLLVLKSGCDVQLAAIDAARLMLLGGGPLEGERYLFWNFVSSSKERLERAQEDYRSGRFPKVVGDESEFIPLPEVTQPRR